MCSYFHLGLFHRGSCGSRLMPKFHAGSKSILPRTTHIDLGFDSFGAWKLSYLQLVLAGLSLRRGVEEVDSENL